MNKYATSIDSIDIHYQIIDTKPIAIAFVHGWLGIQNGGKNQGIFEQRSRRRIQ